MLERIRSSKKIKIVVLAGGKGTRMGSRTPKVLREVGGVPILLRILQEARRLDAKPTIVVGHSGEEVIRATEGACEYAWQTAPLGTGDALRVAGRMLKNRNDVTDIIVISGDHPFVSASTMYNLAFAAQDAVVGFCTITVPRFEGKFRAFSSSGRVVRDEYGKIVGIHEARDATQPYAAPREVNVAIYRFDPSWLWDRLQTLTPHPPAHEYYLTDLISVAAREGYDVRAMPITRYEEGLGVNTQEELAFAEHIASTRALAAS